MKTAPLKAKQLPIRQVKRIVYVVSVNETSLDTGHLVSQRMVGITEDQGEAEVLTQRFNAREMPSEAVQYQAFYLRYTLPYFSPLARQILDGGAEESP